MEMHTLIEEISSLLAKIKSGEAIQADLEAFVTATSQLNERAIVLRYKAYESSVFGETNVSMPNDNPIADIPGTILDSPIEDKTVSTTVETEEPAFDLFAMEDEPINAEIPVENVTESPIVDDFEISANEPIVEVNTNLTDEPSYFDLIEEKAPEEPRYSSSTEPTLNELHQASEASASDEWHPIYKNINQNDGSLTARLMHVRLDTLKGAFGFNERIQIVQELFGGSNDAFSNFIESIELLSQRDEARMLVTQIAVQNRWNADDQLAIELVQKIERKYA